MKRIRYHVKLKCCPYCRKDVEGKPWSEHFHVKHMQVHCDENSILYAILVCQDLSAAIKTERAGILAKELGELTLMVPAEAAIEEVLPKRMNVSLMSEKGRRDH